MFLGEDNDDQLIEILKVLGTDDFFKYLSKFKLRLDSKMKSRIDLYDHFNFSSKGGLRNLGLNTLIKKIKFFAL